MTIERGRNWGEPAGPLSAERAVAATNAALRTGVERARRAGEALEVALVGGDLCRTLGGRGDLGRIRAGDGVRFPIDAVRVELDGGTPHWFVAHLVARRSRWRGRVLAVMNAEFVGPYDVAPRAHPNDGLVDVVDADLRFGDRWKAWRRLASGLHVPHPSIRQARVREYEADLAPRTRVWLDGDALGTVEHVRVTVEPDALTVVV